MHNADMQKEYLGDGAYVDFDGYHFKLTAENGIEATDTICLEPEVLKSFFDYVKTTVGEEQFNKLIK